MRAPERKPCTCEDGPASIRPARRSAARPIAYASARSGPQRAPRRAEASISARKPWEALGVSLATWCRLKRQVSLMAPTAEARLGGYGHRHGIGRGAAIGLGVAGLAAGGLAAGAYGNRYGDRYDRPVGYREGYGYRGGYGRGGYGYGEGDYGGY